MRLKNIFRDMPVLILLALVSQPAISAPTDLSWTRITEVDGGWTGAYMQITTVATFVNPDVCAWAGEYQIDPSTPGYQLFESMVISAFLAGKEIMLTVNGCSGNRPNVIAVKMR
jgi:hypothetical protein